MFPPRKLPGLDWLALAALVAVVFWPVLTFDFVRWDDDIAVLQNPLLTEPWSWSLAGQFLTGEQALRFKPLIHLCFRLLHAVFGFNPIGWHAFSLGLHVAATVLYYVILRRIFRQLVPAATESWVGWGAGLGAALWALHPLRAEAVAWVTAASYPLTALGLLLSFACYLEAWQNPARARRWLVLAWGFAVSAYGSYPVSVTYGLWLVAVDRWLLPAAPPPSGPGWFSLNRSLVAKYAWFLVPAGLAVGITLWSRLMTPGIFSAAPTVQSVGGLDRLVMALAALTYFVRVLFWPANLTPNMLPLAAVRGDVTLLVMAMLAVLGLAFVWHRRQRHPAGVAVWFGFAALAVPCLGLTERPTWPVDRYSYVVHLVLVGGLTGSLVGWAGTVRSRQVAVSIGAVALLSVSAWATHGQIMIWRDSPALFRHMELHPDFAANPRQQGHVYVLWARSELAAGRPAAAASLLNKAQQVYLAAIQAALARQDYPDALELSLQLDHYFTLTPVMHRERGAWLLHLGRRAEALTELEVARAALPDDARVRSLIQEAQR